MKVGSLFSGIGGFELGLQMASLDFEIAWQVEQDEFCQTVLALSLIHISEPTRPY